MDEVAFVLVRRDTFNAQLLGALVTECLHWLYVRYVPIAELLDNALLVDERFV